MSNMAGVKRITLSSSPARGTWIEMPSLTVWPYLTLVVPRKGDVDRNQFGIDGLLLFVRRPPQGGRG